MDEQEADALADEILAFFNGLDPHRNFHFDIELRHQRSDAAWVVLVIDHFIQDDEPLAFASRAEWEACRSRLEAE